MYGKHTFSVKVKEAISFMKTASPLSYSMALSLVTNINESPVSGANFNKSRIDLSLASCPEKYWCSSVILHEAIHFLQLKEDRYDYLSHDQAEFEANMEQLKYLEEVAAPTYVLSYLRSLIAAGSRHADINGDGVYDHRDYRLRRY